jgi:DNA oxidative demethylase
MPDLLAAAGILEEPPYEAMAPGAVLLRGFALPYVSEILGALNEITARAPFRHMTTPWGAVMSVAMTNCGEAGWLTDRTGYRYDRIDPGTGRPWPAVPDCFRALASAAAAQAGYPGFAPDACLINRYEPGTRLTLHQDKNERDYAQPIVSVSLGLPATFQFGGLKRGDPVRKFTVRHGDVAVWGGPSRLYYHGVAELKEGEHELLGRLRINLTFRWAL